MWFWMTEVRVDLLLMLLTQLGSWEYHTSVCPRMSFWLVPAQLTVTPESAHMSRKTKLFHHIAYPDNQLFRSWTCFATLCCVSYRFMGYHQSRSKPSVASHFILFSGVTCPKFAWTMAAFFPVVRRPWSVAIPKYFLPLARNFTSTLFCPPVL